MLCVPSRNLLDCTWTHRAHAVYPVRRGIGLIDEWIVYTLPPVPARYQCLWDRKPGVHDVPAANLCSYRFCYLPAVRRGHVQQCDGRWCMYTL